MDPIPIPEASVLFTLPQPGFATVAPDIARAELIPDNIRHAMDQAWSVRQFPSRPLRVALLEDVFVAGEGLVFASDLRCYAATRSAYADHEIAQVRSDLLGRIAAASVPTLPREAVLCKKRGAYNYGHFLLEMFSRAVVADRFALGRDPDFLVLDPTGGMARAMGQAFALAGIDAARVRWTTQEPVFARKLLVVDGLTEHGRYMSPHAPAALDRLRRPMPGVSRPLYVSRGSAQWRGLANEAEIVAALGARGFAVCDPGTMDVDAQIAAFQDASCVVGMIGAGLANVAFCRAGTPVTMFVPAGMPDTFFWFLAQHRGLPYREVRLADAHALPEAVGFEAWDRHMRLPVGMLDLVLR